MVFSIISKGLLLTLVLMAIKNYDRIVERRSAVPMISVTEERFVRTEWLAGNLKSNYVSRCQICGHSFRVVYGVAGCLCKNRHIGAAPRLRGVAPERGSGGLLAFASMR